MILSTFVRKHFERLVHVCQVTLDGIVVLGCCLCAFWMRREFGGDATQLQVYTQLFFWIVILCLGVFGVCGLYRTEKSLLNIDEYRAVLKSTIIAFLLTHTLVFFLRETERQPEGGVVDVLLWGRALLGRLPFLWQDASLPNPDAYSRAVLLASFVFIYIGVTAERFFTFRAIQVAHRRGIGNTSVLIFGTGDVAVHLREKLLLSPTLGIHFRGFLRDGPEGAPEVVSRVPAEEVIGCLEDLARCVSELKISTVFVAIPESGEERVVEVTEAVAATGAQVKIVPSLIHLLAQPVTITNLESVPLIAPRMVAERLSTRIPKRVLDVALSVAVLVATLPLFLVLPFLIRRESKGRAFFTQIRIGKDGRPFPMLKFRTMFGTADEESPRSGEDPRVTRVGRWLRRTSLDELPQLLNVLRGEMSVVGPRPEMPFVVENYGALARERLRVKPGITGLWQISYARLDPIHENLDFDLYYVENQSVLLDVVIVFLTCFSVLKGTGAR